VTGGTLTNFTGSGTSYAATFTPTANSIESGIVSVASSKFSDSAGNQNSDGAESNNTVTMSVDTVVPTIAVTSTKTALKAGETATVSFTLSESSTDFVAGDVTVTGGVLSNFTGSGTSYTATFTPTANSTANGVVSVASSKFSDAAGNQNSDGADTNNNVTIAVDTLVPLWFSSNGHYYDLIITQNVWVHNVNTGGTWASAAARAESMSFRGLSGYLATITTADENSLIQEIVKARGLYTNDPGYYIYAFQNGINQGGKGARLQGHVRLEAGDILRIAVAGAGGNGTVYLQQGETIPSCHHSVTSGGGGGGASSIVKVNGSVYTPLLFAAGGGGASFKPQLGYPGEIGHWEPPFAPDGTGRVGSATTVA
jgi:hypothetical protein